MTIARQGLKEVMLGLGLRPQNSGLSLGLGLAFRGLGHMTLNAAA